MGEELIEKERVIGLSESAQVRRGQWGRSCLLLFQGWLLGARSARTFAQQCASSPSLHCSRCRAGPDQAQAAEGQRGRARRGEAGLASCWRVEQWSCLACLIIPMLPHLPPLLQYI